MEGDDAVAPAFAFAPPRETDLSRATGAGDLHPRSWKRGGQGNDAAPFFRCQARVGGIAEVVGCFDDRVQHDSPAE